MAANDLTMEEREQIVIGLCKDWSARRIGPEIGRHHTAVSRELKRNGGRENYSAAKAQRRAEEQKKRPKTPMLVGDTALASHISKRLAKKDSPWRIAFELARGVWGFVAKVSHETIYQGIYGGLLDVGPNEAFKHTHLGRRRRKHRKRKVPNSNSLGIICLIHDRPEVANARSEVGHLEGDQIVGPYNRSAMLTVIDRKSSHIWLARLPNGKGAKETTKALIWLLRRIPPEFRRTLTWDRGAELVQHPRIALTVGIDIYFADPKSPWQRPQSERANSEIRDYVGHGIDLRTYTNRQLRYFEQRLNTKPRRSLNGATAASIYHQGVALTD